MQRGEQLHLKGGRARYFSASDKFGISVFQCIGHSICVKMVGVNILVGIGGWLNMFLVGMAFIISNGIYDMVKSMGKISPVMFHRSPTLGQL